MSEMNSIKKPLFLWYVLSVNVQNISLILESIENLKTKRIKQVINLSDIFESSKIKSRVIFIHAYLTNKLKQAILEINGIRFFMPNNNSPYVCNDLDGFLKYHFKKNKIAEIKEKYLHKHEINKGYHTKINIYPVQNTQTINSNYKIGDIILINNGIFKNSCGIIHSIKERELNVEIQMENSSANIYTVVNIYDTELIKK